MIIDYNLQVAAAEAFTDTSKASTSHIDALAVCNDYNTPLWFVVRVKAAFTSGTTMTFSLQCDDNDSFTSAKTLATSEALAPAALTADTIVWKTRIPPGCERYLRGYGTVAGTFDAGTVDMFFTPDIAVGW